MAFLDFLQRLSPPFQLAATIVISLAVGWFILAIVRLSFRKIGLEGAKSPYVSELVTVISVLFALMLSFSAAGVWNDWVQAQNAVRREAMALENVLGLTTGMAPDRAAKIRERVFTYVRNAAEQEWPAMARHADMDDPVFKVLDGTLADLTVELSRAIAYGDASPITVMLLPQIFEVRSARLARLTMADSTVSGIQWLALVVLIVCLQVVIAILYNNDRRTQILAVNLVAISAAAAFFVLVAQDRPFAGTISVSPRPLLLLTAKAYPDAEPPTSPGPQLAPVTRAQ
jgi:hypothetical protein